MRRWAAIFSLLAVGFLLPQVVDCSAWGANLTPMACCRLMQYCHASHAGRDCCKRKVAAHRPSFLLSGPAVRVRPETAVLLSFHQAQAGLLESPRPAFEAPQHSPPELYTLHASLRI